MIGQNSLTHVNWSDRIGLDIIPLDTIPFSHSKMHFLDVIVVTYGNLLVVWG